MSRKKEIMRIAVLISVSIMLLLCPRVSYAQLAAFSSTNPSNLTVCGDAQSFTIKISNTSLSDTLKKGKATLRLPTGFHYVASSVSSSKSVSEYSTSVANAPVFNIPDINPKDSVKFSIKATVDCNVIAFINSGGAIRNFVKFAYNSTYADSGNTSFYSVGVPSISISKFTNQAYTGTIGDTFSRFIIITNTANAPLKNFVFDIKKGTGLQIKALSKTYTTSSDTAIMSFDATDFKKIGNGDSYFDQGEKIVIKETDSIIACTGLGNSYFVMWGCNGSYCQKYTTTSNVVLAAKLPNLVGTTTSAQGQCYTISTANGQGLTIINHGSGPAKNVVINVMQTANVYGGYANWYYSKIDISSLTIQYGSKAAKTLKPDTAYPNYPYTCLGSNPMAAFKYTIPVIKAGDTVTFNWDEYNCCIDQGYINGWGYTIDYTDQCGTTPYSTAGYGRYYWQNYQLFGVPVANTTDLIVGDTVNVYLQNNYLYSNLLPGVGNAYIQYWLHIPSSIKVNTSTIKWTDITGAYVWKPDSVKTVGTYLHVSFSLSNMPSGFAYYGSRFYIQMVGDTTGGVKCGSQVSVPFTIYYKARPSCNCTSTLADNFSTFKLNCVNPDRVGLNNAKFTFMRTSYGLPDNNDDGAPDASGSLDFTKIRRDKAMYGDTVTASLTGRVITNSSYPSWKYGFADLKFTDDYLSQLDITLTIKDSTNKKTYICSHVPWIKSGKNFFYYFGTDTLRNAGCTGIPSGFTYKQGDSVFITIRYKVTQNTQDVHYITLDDEFYFSTTSSPSTLLDHYSVNKKPAYFYSVGYYFIAYGPESIAANGCSGASFSESFYLSVGNCCSNYYGGNIFPYEYRYWASFNKMKVLMPANYKFKSATMYYYPTQGTGKYGVYSSAIGLSAQSGDTLIFNLDSMYKPLGGPFPLSDDGYAGTLVFFCQPTCATIASTYQPINYWEYFSQSAFLGGGETVPYTDADYVTYTPPSFTLQAALPTISSQADTMSWTVYVTNKSVSSPATKAWIGVQSADGKILIDTVFKGTKKINATKDIFRLDTIAASKTTTLKVKARMKNCVLDSVKLVYGWDCNQYPDSMASAMCTTQSIWLYADPKLPGLQIKSSSSAPDSIYLCDTATYTLTVTNTQSGSAKDVNLQVNLPPGMKIVKGSSKIEYPSTGSFTTISEPDSINPYLYDYQLTKASSYVNTHGFPGYFDTIRNVFQLKFRAVTNCDYVSGSALNYIVTATDVCGNVVSTTGLDEKSLKIIGAKTPYSGALSVSGTTTLTGCGGVSKIRLKFVNNGPVSTDSTDYIYIDFPKGMRYVSGSLVKVHNSVDDASLTATPLGTATRYQWKIPKGVVMGDSIVYTINYASDSTLSCGTAAVSLQTVTTLKITCISTHLACAIKVLTGIASKNFTITKPKISISGFTATAVPAAPGGEKVTVKATLTNSGDSLKANSHSVIKYYFDKDGDKKYSTGDILLATDTVNVLIKPSGTYNENKTFTVPAGKACSLVMLWDTVKQNCACTPVQAWYGTVQLHDAGNDTTLCTGFSAKMGTDSISGYKYSWSPSSGLSNANTARPIVNLTNPGSSTITKTYTLTTVRGTGCTSADSVRVTVYPQIVAKAGSQKTICVKSSTTLGGSPAATGGSGTYTYQWSPGSGLNSTAAANPTASPSATTKYTLQVTDSKGCTASDTVTVFVRPIPVASAGPDKTICAKDTVVIGGSPSGAGTTSPYSYAWSPNAALSSTSAANPKASPNFTTNYILTVTDAKGCSNKDTMTLTVNPLPILNAGTASSICPGDSIKLGGAPTASGNGAFAYKWSPAAGLSDTTSANPKASPAAATAYTLKVTDGKGCKNTASVAIGLYSQPKASAGSAKRICIGSSAAIGGSPTGSSGKTPYTYSWSPASGLSSTSVANPAAKPTLSGTYKLLLTDANGCKARDSVNVNVNPLPVISAGPDDTLCAGDSFTFGATSAYTYSYSWSPGKYIKDSSRLTAKASPIATTQYVLSAKDSIGCSNTDTAIIYVRPKTALGPPNLRCADVVSKNSISLTWDPVSANSQFYFYTVYRKAGSGVFTQAAKFYPYTTSTWIDNTVTRADSIPYQYFITVTNHCGIEGKGSDTLNPIILKAVKTGDKTLTLSWNSFSTGANTYKVLYDTGSGYKTWTSTAANSLTLKSCYLDAVWKIQVISGSCSSNSYPSPAIKLQDNTPPSVNIITEATTDKWGQVRLIFKPSDSTDTKTYLIYKGDSSGTYSQVASISHVKGKTSYTYTDNAVSAQKTQYFYKIKAADTCGNTGSFSVANSPVLLKGTAGNLRNVLNWRNYIGFTADTVAVQKWNGTQWKNLKVLASTDTGYTDSVALGCNITYYYRIAIRSATAAVYSYSDSVALTPYDTVRPARVDMISASVVSSSAIRISFNKVTDVDVNRYDVYASKDHGAYTKIATVLRPASGPVSYLYSGINTRQDTFRFMVYALDSCGNNVSATSEVHRAVDLKGDSADYANHLHWNTYKGFTVKNYVIQRLKAGTWTDIATLGGTDSLYTDTFLTCNTKYYYRVKVLENGGAFATAFSDSIVLTPFDTISPVKPVFLSVTVPANGQVQLQWTKSTSNDVRNYNIYRKAGSSYNLIATAADVNTYTDNGVSTLVSNSYKIQAIDSCARNTSVITAPQATVALAVSTNGCEPANYLTWNDYAGWAGVAKYEIYRTVNGGVETLLTTLSSGTSYKDSGLSYHNNYCYRIKAYELSGPAVSYSNSFCSQVYFADTPVVLVATKLNSSATAGQIRLKWTSQKGKRYLSYYRLYYSTSGHMPYTLLKDSIPMATDSFIHTGLNTKVGDYYYYLQTMDSCGVLSEISTVHKTMDLNFHVGQLVHQLNWTPYKGWPVKYYVVQHGTGLTLSDEDTLKGTDTSLRKFPAPCNTRIVYRIKAVSYTGEISYSDSMGGQAIDTVPSNAPTMQNVSVLSGNTVQVTFLGADSLDTYGYSIQRSKNGGAFATAGFINFTSAHALHQFVDTVNTLKDQLCYKVITLDSCLNATPSETFCAMQLSGIPLNLANSLAWTNFKGYGISKYQVLLYQNSGWQNLANVNTDSVYIHSPLSCNVPRAYKIQGFGTGGFNTYSDSITLTPFDTTRPAAPTIVNATVLNNTTVRLNWNFSASAKVKQYEVQYQSPHGAWTVFTTVSLQNAVNITGLKAHDSAYSFRVIAIDTCAGNRSFSSPVHTTVLLDGIGKNLSNQLNWSAYQGFTVNRYVIWKYINGTWKKLDSTGSSTLGYLDQGLSCNVPYSYKILAISSNPAVTSYSDSISATPFDTTRPAAPVVNYATVTGPSTVLLSWNLSASSKVKDYEIQVKSPNGVYTVFKTVTLKTSLTITGLDTKDSAYDFRVIAIDTCAGNRSLNSAVHQTILLGGTGKNLSNQLNWSAYQGFAVKKYIIWKQVSSAWKKIDSVAGSALSYLDTGLSCNVPYLYKVLAVSNTTAYTSYSDSVSITPYDTTRPKSPVINYATVLGPTSILLNWNLSASKKVKQYEVQIKSPNGVYKVAATLTLQTSYTFTGLKTHDSAYSFRVIAIDTCMGNRSLNGTVHQTVLLGGKPGNNLNKLSWSAYQGFGVNRYIIYKNINKVWVKTDSVPGTSTSYIDTGLSCNVPRYYKVLAISAANAANASFSDSISLTPYDSIKPATPSIQYVTVLNGSQVQLFWNKAVPKVKQYDIWIKSAKGPWIYYFNTFNTYNLVFSGLKTFDSTYSFRIDVKDTCAGNVSDFSPPHTMIHIDGTPGDQRNNLTWTPYQGFSVKKYYIYLYQNSKWQRLDSVSNSASTYTHNPAACNVTKYYKIAALDATGKYLSFSDSIGLTPFDTIKPPAPLLKSVTVLPNSTVKVNWHWDRTTDVTKFEVWRSTNGGAPAKVGSIGYDSSFIDTKVNPKADRNAYYVIAIDSCSNLNRSQPSRTDTIIQPFIKSGGCRAYMQLTWKPYVSLGAGTTSYEVYKSKNGSAYNLLATVSSPLIYTDFAVDSINHFSYFVKALNTATPEVSYSDTIGRQPWQYAIPRASSLAVASIIKTDPANGIVKINWKPYPFAIDTVAKGYRLYFSYSKAGPYKLILDTRDETATTYTYSGINTRDSQVYFYLKVFNRCLLEGDSNAIHSTPKLSLQNKDLEIALTWKPYEGMNPVKSYHIYRSKDHSYFGLLATISGNITSYADTAVSCGHRYDYKVAAVDNDPTVAEGFSDSMGAVAFDTLKPIAPAIYYATTSITGKDTGEVIINFKGNIKRNRAGYRIYASADGISYSIADSSRQLFNDTIVWPQHRLNTLTYPYSFYIRAYDTCGNLSASSDTQAVVHLSVTGKSHAEVLNWTPYRGWQQWNYTVQRRTPGTPWIPLVILPKDSLSFTDNYVKCDTFYLYRIVSADLQHYNNLSLSNLAGVTAFDNDAPVPPAVRHASVLQTDTKNGKIELSWAPSASHDVAWYNIRRRNPVTGTWELIVTKYFGTTYTDSNLNTWRTRYDYMVDAVDSCRNPNIGSSTVHSNMVLVAMPGNQSVKLSWNAYTGWKPIYYDIYRDGAKINRIAGTTPAYIDSPAMCPVMYHYTIQAIDSADSANIAVSNIDSAQPFDNVAPKAPYLIKATVSQPNNEVSLVWNRSIDYDVKGYRVMRKVSPMNYYAEIYRTASAVDTAYTDTVLTDSISRQNGSLCYIIEAFDHCDNHSAASNPACVIIVQGEAKPLANLLHWNPYQQWPAGVDHYNLYRKTDDTAGYKLLQSFTAPVFIYTDTGFVADGRHYCYRIEAIENGGLRASSWSTELCLVQQPLVWIPNAFTPNMSLNINDRFGPKGLFMARYEMDIYNRWGQRLFFTDKSETWDGSYRGQPAGEGVYMYHITVYGHDGKRYYFEGTVEILR